VDTEASLTMPNFAPVLLRQSPLFKANLSRIGSTFLSSPTILANEMVCLSSLSTLSAVVTNATFNLTKLDETSMIKSTQMVNSVIRSETSLLIRRLRTKGEEDGNEPEHEYSYQANIEGSRDNGESIEEREFASKRIILAGFSQGGVSHSYVTVAVL
jgi:hypothetical protein